MWVSSGLVRGDQVGYKCPSLINSLCSAEMSSSFKSISKCLSANCLNFGPPRLTESLLLIMTNTNGEHL